MDVQLAFRHALDQGISDVCHQVCALKLRMQRC